MLASSLSFFENWKTTSYTAVGIGVSAGCCAIGGHLAGYKVTSSALFGAFDGAVQGAMLGIWNQVFHPSSGQAACISGTVAITSALFAGPAISWQLCKFVGHDVGGYGDAIMLQSMILAAASGIVPGLIALAAVGNSLYEGVRPRMREQAPLVPPPPLV